MGLSSQVVEVRHSFLEEAAGSEETAGSHGGVHAGPGAVRGYKQNVLPPLAPAPGSFGTQLWGGPHTAAMLLARRL